MAEGARHGFEQKGVVRVGSRDLQGHPVSLEAALEAALEAGAQDVCPDEEEEEEEEEEEPALKVSEEDGELADTGFGWFWSRRGGPLGAPTALGCSLATAGHSLPSKTILDHHWLSPTTLGHSPSILSHSLSTVCHFQPSKTILDHC